MNRLAWHERAIRLEFDHSLDSFTSPGKSSIRIRVLPDRLSNEKSPQGWGLIRCSFEESFAIFVPSGLEIRHAWMVAGSCNGIAQMFDQA
jgi:hypothetical protein